MSGTQIVIAILGLGLLAGGTYGTTGFLEGRKEVRLEEIRSEERRAAVEAMQFANAEQVKIFKEVLETMKAQNEASNRAAEVALRTQEHLLAAAARTPETIIEGQHLSRDEAKELRSSPRRASYKVIVVQEMRVVDVNTSDPSHTTVIVENLETLAQHRITFRDAFIAEEKRDTVIDVLKKRRPALAALGERAIAALF